MFENKELKKIFDLSKADCELFNYIFNHPIKKFSTEDLSKRMDLHLATIQRGVKKLYDNCLLKIYQENLKGGGYRLLYKLRRHNELKRIFLDTAYKNHVEFCKIIDENFGGIEND